MSDQQTGPGWWQASYGRWYPPERISTRPTAPSMLLRVPMWALT